MQSVFRVYALTHKTLDPYLYNQLCSFGLKPKHEELLHAFYCNANFQHIFRLSFHSQTVQNLYIQIGHKIPMYSRYLQSGRTAEEQFSEHLRKINFKGFMPIERNLIGRITMNLIIRESTRNLPSQNAILGILKNHLYKESVLKEYRKMVGPENNERLEDYYNIKMMIENKWLNEQNETKQDQQKLLNNNFQYSKQLPVNQQNKSLIGKKQSGLENLESSSLDLSKPLALYNPHIIFYIRRNHGRFLLKINKESLYKHGWKKHVGWGPIRETLAASILYRTGLIQRLKHQGKQMRLWDPFCGSSTIPLVALSMFSSLAIRQDYMSNFVWPNWPIFKQQYLQTYIQKIQADRKRNVCRIFASDNSLEMVKYSIDNFEKLLDNHFISAQTETDFIKILPSDQIFSPLKNSIHIGYGDFQQMGKKIFNKTTKKVTIITNLPYLNQRSKQHHPLNQLTSIYRRFNNMVQNYRQQIENVFVIVDKNGINNPNHFLSVSSEEWRILSTFSNGGIDIVLLGWQKNIDGWINMNKVSLSISDKKQINSFQQQKNNLLQQYRQQKKNIANKQYMLPKYLADPSSKRGYRRTLEKRKARHLRVAYQRFSRIRQGNQIYAKYAKKQLALRLSKRGQAWKKKSMSIIGKLLPQNEKIIKQEFEKRIEEGLQRLQKIKKNKKQGRNNKKVSKIW